MDLIQECLSLVPVPFLQPAFGVFRSIWQGIERVASYRFQFEELARSIALLLYGINKRFQLKPLEDSDTSTSTLDALCDLGSLLSRILTSVENQQSYKFFKMFFAKDDIQMTIDSYYKSITMAYRTFQITASLDMQSSQHENSIARAKDHQEVLEKLFRIESNQNLMVEELNVYKKNPKVMIATLQKRLLEHQGNEIEHRLFSRSLTHMKKATGVNVHLQTWTVTRLDIEFGEVIAQGGFGVVKKGIWNGTNVAVKTLQNTEGITPRETDLCEEIKTWSKLRHPHVLQFLGANVMDDHPFIVMPLIQNGNVRDYLRKNPNCDRVKIIHQISQGIVYLHSLNVIHGDLKGLNVLIDDGERALLCDFGLSRMKDDVDSRSLDKSSSTGQGSVAWMAPERLDGKSLRKPCDIYSFALTMYEIHTDTTPLARLPHNSFHQFVVVHQKRPEIPTDGEAPQLDKDGWNLIIRCWAPKPQDRPLIGQICEELANMAASPDRAIPNFSSNLPPYSDKSSASASTLPRAMNGQLGGFQSNSNSQSTTQKAEAQTAQSFFEGGQGHEHPPITGRLFVSEPESMFETPPINPYSPPPQLYPGSMPFPQAPGPVPQPSYPNSYNAVGSGYEQHGNIYMSSNQKGHPPPQRAYYDPAATGSAPSNYPYYPNDFPFIRSPQNFNQRSSTAPPAPMFPQAEFYHHS